MAYLTSSFIATYYFVLLDPCGVFFASFLILSNRFYAACFLLYFFLSIFTMIQDDADEETKDAKNVPEEDEDEEEEVGSYFHE